ncbi:MAG TPA: L-fucose:H+ symporter permease [Saprospiraceae bacterium]|nr:L-fucose:H+ symporter permease [Saprospiraceae bacterium]
MEGIAAEAMPADSDNNIALQQYRNMTPKRTPILAFALITSLFLMWGLANNMTDTLLAAFKKIMSMTDYQTAFVQYSFYGAYFCLAIPAAILIKKFTYKTGVLIGLGLFIAGGLLFYPASQTMVYGHFLTALFILAGGLSILETTANPYIIAMGPEETGTQRLNLAQSFNPIGSIIGVLLSKVFILSNLNQADATQRAAMQVEDLQAIQAEELGAVMGPYVGVAFFLLALWLAIAFTKMPKASDEDHLIDFRAAFGRLIRRPHYVWAVAAQFFYVGAQIGVWSFTIRYVMQELGLNEEQASSYYLAALILFLASRFVCTFLMRYIEPRRLLMGLAVLAIAFTAVVIFGSGAIAVYALVAISACMSLMFPTIYGLGLRGLGQDTKIGGSGLIMAILGGAVLTGVQGKVSDATGDIHYAFFVPLLCFAIVAYYGLVARRLRTAAV